MFSRIESYITQLQADPVNFLITMAYTWGVILFSLILHECAHGYVALKCGDPTAKMMGRLSLNPARHLHPVGTLFMFVFGFGWAKPVPVNPRNFRDYRRDDFYVSIAGIVVNLTIFILATLLSCIVNRIMMGEETLAVIMEAYDVGVEPFLSPMYNVGGYLMDGDWIKLAEFYPYAYGMDEIKGIYFLEGWEALKQVLSVPWLLWVQRLLLLLAQVNLSLAVFNLLPMPPLDGFHLLNDTLLRGKLRLDARMFQIAQFVLLALMFTGAFGELLHFLTSHLYEAVLRVFMMLTGQM
nr:site-2 protease family protein [Clostridia bacterium]